MEMYEFRYFTDVCSQGPFRWQAIIRKDNG